MGKSSVKIMKQGVTDNHEIKGDQDGVTSKLDVTSVDVNNMMLP